MHSPTQSSNAISNVIIVGLDLVPQEEASLQANVTNAKTLHAQWKLKDTMFPVDRKALIGCRRQHCKNIGLSVFGFTLQEAQIDAIYTLFYKQKDLLFFTKIGFSKSLIY